MTAEQVAAALTTLPSERLLEVAALLIDARDAMAGTRHQRFSARKRLNVFLVEQVARTAEGQRQDADAAQRALFEGGA